MKPTIKVENNRLVLTKQLSKTETYKINEKGKMFSLTIYEEPIWIAGYNSMCSDGKHITVIDWDGVSKRIAVNDMESRIKEEKLSPFYLFKTKEDEIEGELVGNYHGLCLTKRRASTVKETLLNTNCDIAFKSMPLRTPFRSWVLRASAKGERTKPEFIGVIGDTNLDKEISTAHLKLLNKLYNIPKINYKNEDGLNGCYLERYQTRDI